MVLEANLVQGYLYAPDYRQQYFKTNLQIAVLEHPWSVMSIKVITTFQANVIG